MLGLLPHYDIAQTDETTQYLDEGTPSPSIHASQSHKRHHMSEANLALNLVLDGLPSGIRSNPSAYNPLDYIVTNFPDYNKEGEYLGSRQRNPKSH